MKLKIDEPVDTVDISRTERDRELDEQKNMFTAQSHKRVSTLGSQSSGRSGWISGELLFTDQWI